MVFFTFDVHSGFVDYIKNILYKFCHTPNMGFATKCGVQKHMRPRECV
jgi:hypothetical protein